jgi:hypothetical protein
MKRAVEIGSGVMICIQSFMNVGTGIQAILRFCLSNLEDCNVSVTDGLDL